jgi:hypothetical protein
MKSKRRCNLVCLAVSGAFLSFGLVGGTFLPFGFVGAARAAADSIERTTLANGLSVYTYAGDYPESYVSVRLVVDPPPVLPGSREFRQFQVLAYSVFRGESPSDDLFQYLEKQGCYGGVWMEYREAIFEFDVFPEHLDTLFARMARQWETGISDEQVRMGARETKEALSDFYDPVMERLGCLARNGVLLGRPIGQWDIPYQFDTLMRAHNLSLVLVGSKANVDRALAAAKVLERIPEGRHATVSLMEGFPGVRIVAPPVNVVSFVYPTWAKVYATYEDLLRGKVDLGAEGLWGLTLVAGRDGAASPAEAEFYFQAILSRLIDVVALGHGSAYSVGGNLYIGESERMMAFSPASVEEITDHDGLDEEMEAAVAELADPSSLDWWRGFVEGQAREETFYGLGAPDASSAADGVAEFVTFARLEGRPDLSGPYLPSPEEAREGFARFLSSAEWYVIEPPSSSWTSAAYASVASGVSYVYGGLFGPDDRTRALAVMCQCLLVLLVLRKVERRMEGNPADNTRRGESS